MANARVQTNESEASPESDEAVVNLGARLREVRVASGMSLRAVARELNVSPSFVSQLENGHSRPSVATLYSLAQLLNVSMDQLFEPEDAAAVPPAVAAVEPSAAAPISRSTLGSPADAWHAESRSRRLSVTTQGNRSRLVMDTGVVWEQLASSAGHGVDFIEIVYPPGSSSTPNGGMLRHGGYECGYLLEGELEITVGFESTIVRSGEAVGFDCSVPHLFRNPGTVPARGIWCVFHEHP
jgi:transcriptional regulator with XRE-family HTH domain